MPWPQDRMFSTGSHRTCVGPLRWRGRGQGLFYAFWSNYEKKFKLKQSKQRLCCFLGLTGSLLTFCAFLTWAVRLVGSYTQSPLTKTQMV